MPRGDGKSIVDLNPWLAGIKFVSRETGELRPVFPEGAQTQFHVLIEHAVRVGWFNSPHRTQSDIKKRCEEAASTGAYRKIDPRASQDREVYGGKISDAALYFRQDTRARDYLFNFLEYQGHPIWEIYNKHLLLYDKLYSYYQNRPWDKDKIIDPKELQQATEFLESSISIMRALQAIHSDMIFKIYEKEKIKTGVQQVGSTDGGYAEPEETDPEFDT